MAFSIQIRVLKEVEEIHTCPVTVQEHNQIIEGDLMLEDVVWGDETKNKVKEIDASYSYELMHQLIKDEEEVS